MLTTSTCLFFVTGIGLVAVASASSILYYSKGNRTGRVDFDLPEGVLNFQLAAAITVVFIILAIMTLALAFKWITKRVKLKIWKNTYMYSIKRTKMMLPM